jgi:uncharacterized repeat protein (TIGR04138 family)
MDENPYQAPQTRSYDVAETRREDWADHVPRGLLHHEYDPTGTLFSDAAAHSGLVVDGLRFVFDAMAWAPDLLGTSPEAPTSAQALCIAMVRYAQEIFDAAGLAALRDWGMESGDDVGRYVHAMVQRGLMEASNEAKMEDFKGVGPLRGFVR